jgi:hypothetical protein
MIPEMIVKGGIALDSLPTAGAFAPLECLAELHQAFSKTLGMWRGTLKRYQGCTRSYAGAILYGCACSINAFFSWYQKLYANDKDSLALFHGEHIVKFFA